MSLTDSQIRGNMIKALELLIADVRNFDLPISQSGGEYFVKAGDFGKKDGQRRFWVALIAIADDATSARETAQYASKLSL